MLLCSGSSHPSLAQEIAAYLGVALTPVQLGHFPDGEISVEIPVSVRGEDLFVLQTIARQPNEYLVELLIMIDALKRASAKSITAVIPYFGYCRQDRKSRPRDPITAKLVANLIATAGATHLLTMDLHAGQLEGFFDIPVDHLHAMPLLGKSFLERAGGQNYVVVAPDIGSVKLAHTYAKFLHTDLVIIDKQRLSPQLTEVVAVIGDVEEKNVLLADDMCSTGETLMSAAKACREKGAKKIFAAVTHGWFDEKTILALEESPIEALLVCNTIPPHPRSTNSTKLNIVSVAPLFGHAIRCIASQVPTSMHASQSAM
jgi:ribose-phosphate pyrophosphokinase